MVPAHTSPLSVSAHCRWRRGWRPVPGLTWLLLRGFSSHSFHWVQWCPGYLPLLCQQVQFLADNSGGEAAVWGGTCTRNIESWAAPHTSQPLPGVYEKPVGWLLPFCPLLSLLPQNSHLTNPNHLKKKGLSPFSYLKSCTLESHLGWTTGYWSPHPSGLMGEPTLLRSAVPFQPGTTVWFGYLRDLRKTCWVSSFLESC